jgi:hypothetical protein
MSDLISPIMSRYANFTMTSDGLAEINSLTYLGFESDFADPLPDQRLALVLVEPRLLAPSGDPALQPALMQSLRQTQGGPAGRGFADPVHCCRSVWRAAAQGRSRRARGAAVLP